MNYTPVSIDINSISSKKDLLRLAEEVNKTKTPRALTKDDKTLALLMPAETDIFEMLSRNVTFIKQAEEAKKQLLKNPMHFTNFTKKYSHLIRTS